MIGRLRRHTQLAALLLSASCCSWAGALCTSGERVLFSCRMKEKSVALCASADLGRTTGYVQYRFGTAQKLELQYPKEKEPAESNFFISSIAYSGGGEARVRFLRNNVSYYIYERTVKSNAAFAPGEHVEYGLITQSAAHGLTRRLCSQGTETGFASEVHTIFNRETWSPLP
jgi:hypothetical protein